MRAHLTDELEFNTWRNSMIHQSIPRQGPSRRPDAVGAAHSIAFAVVGTTGQMKLSTNSRPSTQRMEQELLYTGVAIAYRTVWRVWPFLLSARPIGAFYWRPVEAAYVDASHATAAKH